MNKSVVDSLGHILCVLWKELKYPNDLDILMTKFLKHLTRSAPLELWKRGAAVAITEVIVVILTNCQSNTQSTRNLSGKLTNKESNICLHYSYFFNIPKAHADCAKCMLLCWSLEHSACYFPIIIKHTKNGGISSYCINTILGAFRPFLVFFSEMIICS